MNFDFNTVLRFVNVGLALVPEGKAVFDMLKTTFSEDEQSVLDRALADSRKAADDQHTHAQNL